MKKYIIVFLIFVSAILCKSEMTNGVFYIDKSTECHFISQNGMVATNQLIGGKTYMVESALVELITTNQTTLFFSGGPTIGVGSNSVISVNLFDQEVNNLNAQPRKAELGIHNLNINLSKGEFCILYPNSLNSSFLVSTPFTSYELNNGKYFIRVSDKSVIVYVLEGAMNIHGDKKVDKAERGKISVAIPFGDPASGISDKIMTSVKAAQQEEVNRFSSPILATEKIVGNVQFFVVNGRVVGIWMK